MREIFQSSYKLPNFSFTQVRWCFLQTHMTRCHREP